MEDAPALLLGIGNPGRKYEQTRHNIGFDVLRECALRWNVALDRAKFESRWGQGQVQGRKVYLVEPHTYVNLSGRALLGFTRFFKLEAAQVLILCDDVALPLGKIRIRQRGSAGGHNGLKSVEGVLGTREYTRLRVGVGQPAYGLVDHVLGRFRDEEQELVTKVIKLSVEAVEAWLGKGSLAAMNKFNGISLADPARPDEESGETAETSGAKGNSDDQRV